MCLNYSEDPFSRALKSMESHISKCPDSLKNSLKSSIPKRLRDEALMWYEGDRYFNSIIEPNIIDDLIQFSTEERSSYDFSMKYLIDSLLRLAFEIELLQEVKYISNSGKDLVSLRYNTSFKELSNNTKILYYYLAKSIACFIDCFCTESIYRNKVNRSSADFFEVYSNTLFLVSVIDIKRIKGGNKPKKAIEKLNLTQNDRLAILKEVKKGTLLKTVLSDMGCSNSRNKFAKQVISFYHYCEKEITNHISADPLIKWYKQVFV